MILQVTHTLNDPQVIASFNEYMRNATKEAVFIMSENSLLVRATRYSSALDALLGRKLPEFDVEEVDEMDNHFAYPIKEWIQKTQRF